jgi:dephospho-CoA kinase
MSALRTALGDAIVRADGALDRDAMRRKAFADPAVRARLEGILHPMIRQQSADRCAAATSPYVILAVPLLVESGTYRERCNRILVVDCDEQLQVERVAARSGLSEVEVRAIMATQASRAERLAIADDVILNDDGQAALTPQIAALHALYLGFSNGLAKSK